MPYQYEREARKYWVKKLSFPENASYVHVALSLAVTGRVRLHPELQDNFSKQAAAQIIYSMRMRDERSIRMDSL